MCNGIGSHICAGAAVPRGLLIYERHDVRLLFKRLFARDCLIQHLHKWAGLEFHILPSMCFPSLRTSARQIHFLEVLPGHENHIQRKVQWMYPNNSATSHSNSVLGNGGFYELPTLSRNLYFGFLFLPRRSLPAMHFRSPFYGDQAPCNLKKKQVVANLTQQYSVRTEVNLKAVSTRFPEIELDLRRERCLMPT